MVFRFKQLVILFSILISTSRSDVTLSMQNQEQQTHCHSSDSLCAGDKNNGLNDLDTPINVVFTLVNVAQKLNLQNQFRQTVGSLFQHTYLDLNIYVIGSDNDISVAEKIMDEEKQPHTKYKVKKLNIEALSLRLADVIKPFQQMFSKQGSTYFQPLFYLSIGIHRVFPDDVSRCVMLDADLKFTADIGDLYRQFSLFTDDNVIGIAREAQPVYRHLLWQHRREHPGTRAGEPPPDGLTGFNSGVLLLELTKMRSSKLYNSLIRVESVTALREEFHFKGAHLGDQDLFSLLSWKHEELFHVLPCGWNRQLCEWWKDKGYQDVFHLYHDCDPPIYIYHGNCNTPIP